MSSAASVQMGILARRSMLKTLRQPFQLFPIVVFPGMLLAINASGLSRATDIPGFPADSYITFALAVTFMQGSIFALVNTGTNVAADLETGFFDRLALTPLKGAAMLGGLLVGVLVVGVVQSLVYVGMGLLGGAHFETGVAGVAVIVLIGAIGATGFGALGLAAGLRTGSGEAVQGIFPLFFVLLFLSSSNLPRDLIEADWFRTVATLNPISYLLEGIRELMISGWTAGPILGSFAVAVGFLVVGLALATFALRGRLTRT